MKYWLAVVALAVVACSQKSSDVPPPPPPVKETPAAPVEAKADKVGKHSLLLAQAQFTWSEENGERKAKPGAAKLVVLTKNGEKWDRRVIEDEESRVFHKAMCVDNGVLTIGATRALLKLWTPDFKSAQTLWAPTFGGKWDRLRDFELLDATHLAIATHDQGVVALLTKEGDAWSAKELTRKADTFVHEIEVGDVDGDGSSEIYATPSDPNKANTSQSGGIIAFRAPSYAKEDVATFSGSHAKEILVADIDGVPGAELYAAVEAELGGGSVVAPVEIRHYERTGGRWLSRVVAKLDKAVQARVLIATSLRRNDKPELIVTTMKGGIWRITPQAGDGLWATTQIDPDSSGFEHAATAYDIDNDGVNELYVTADDQDEVRQYAWEEKENQFKRTVIATLEKSDITWNILGCGRGY